MLGSAVSALKANFEGRSTEPSQLGSEGTGIDEKQRAAGRVAALDIAMRKLPLESEERGELKSQLDQLVADHGLDPAVDAVVWRSCFHCAREGTYEDGLVVYQLEAIRGLLSRVLGVSYDDTATPGEAGEAGVWLSASLGLEDVFTVGACMQLKLRKRSA